MSGNNHIGEFELDAPFEAIANDPALAAIDEMLNDDLDEFALDDDDQIADSDALNLLI